MTNQTIKREQSIRSIAVLLILISFLSVLTLNREIFVSFLIAFVLSYILSPVVNYLERVGVNRSAAIGIPFFLCFSSLAVTSYVLAPLLTEQMSSLHDNLTEYMMGIKNLMLRWESSFNKLFSNLYTFEWSSLLDQYLKESLDDIVKSIPTIAPTIFTTSLLAPIIAFFMLHDGRTALRKLLAFVPNNFFEMSLNLTYQINEQLGDFIRAKILESIIVGVTVLVGLYLIGFPYTIFLALFAAVTNLIPYVGPIIGAVPAFVLAAINPDLNSLIILVATIYLLAQLIDIIFIIPMIVARTVNLHPVTVLLVIIIGAKLMGVLGMLIAIPVASIIKLTFSALFDHLVHFRT